MRTVVTLILNPAVDTNRIVQAVSPDKKLRAESVRRNSGGVPTEALPRLNRKLDGVVDLAAYIAHRDTGRSEPWRK